MNHQVKLLARILKPKASILLPRGTIHQLSQFTNFLQGFRGPNAKTDWNKAILDAEKVVGYTTSYLNLRFLLSDEMSNIAYHLRSLVGSGHPLLKTAKKILADGKTSMQTRSLTVLLLSKAAGFADQDVTAAEKSSEILQSQRVLAEITEMLHTGFMIHRCIVKIPLKLQKSGDNFSAKENMDFGNKLSILTGDYLFANASTLLASLRNPKVVEIVSAAIGDFSESEFYGKKSANGSQEFDSNFQVSDWLSKIETSAASLLARSCQGALVLSGHSEDHQKKAFELGRNLAIACQANEDITAFNNAVSDSKYDLDGSCLPLVIWLSKNSNNLEASLLPEKIIKMANTDEVLSQAQELKYSHLKMALENLSYFPDGIARNALEKIMNSLR